MVYTGEGGYPWQHRPATCPQFVTTCIANPAQAIANRSSATAIGQSEQPNLSTRSRRIMNPANAPSSAPRMPSSTPSTPGPAIAVAAIEPAMPPRISRQSSGPGEVRFGHLGSLSTTSSATASTVMITAAQSRAVHHAHVPSTGRYPRYANQHITAIGVIDRSPVVKPSSRIASNQDITAIAIPQSFASAQSAAVNLDASCVIRVSVVGSVSRKACRVRGSVLRTQPGIQREPLGHLQHLAADLRQLRSVGPMLQRRDD